MASAAGGTQPPESSPATSELRPQDNNQYQMFPSAPTDHSPDSRTQNPLEHPQIVRSDQPSSEMQIDTKSKLFSPSPSSSSLSHNPVPIGTQRRDSASSGNTHTISLKSRIKSASPGNQKNTDEDTLVSPATNSFKKSSKAERNRRTRTSLRIQEVISEAGSDLMKNSNTNLEKSSEMESVLVDSGSVSGKSQTILPNSAYSNPIRTMEVDTLNQGSVILKNINLQSDQSGTVAGIPSTNPCTPSKSTCTVNRSSMEIPELDGGINGSDELMFLEGEGTDYSDMEDPFLYSAATGHMAESLSRHPESHITDTEKSASLTVTQLEQKNLSSGANCSDPASQPAAQLHNPKSAQILNLNSAQNQTAPTVQKPPTSTTPNQPDPVLNSAQNPTVNPTPNAWQSTNHSYLSLADRIKQSRSSTRVKIAYYPPVITAEGKSRVVITTEDLVKAAKAYPLHLYGYFLGTSMDYNRVNYCLRRDWRKFGISEITKSPAGYYYFKFTSEQGMQGVLEGGPWFVNNIPLFVKKWEPDLCLEKTELAVVPLWVTAHDVPLGLWTDSGICKIMSYTGNPLLMDKVTEHRCTEFTGRVGYARMLVDVLASSNLPTEVEVEFPATGNQLPKVANVKLSYHWKPPVCSHCCVFGHTFNLCKKKPQPIVETPTSPPKEQTKAPIPTVLQQNNPSDGFTVVTYRRKSNKRNATGNLVAQGTMQPKGVNIGNHSHHQKSTINTSSNPEAQRKMSQIHAEFVQQTAQQGTYTLSKPPTQPVINQQPPPPHGQPTAPPTPYKQPPETSS